MRKEEKVIDNMNMSNKMLVLVLVLVLAVLLGGAVDAEQKISQLSGDALIEAVCGGGESECISTLQSAPADKKADAKSLAFFTLRFVENHAENMSSGIKKINEIPDVAPLLQSALTDCMDQYNSLDDLIEDAILAVETHTYPEALKFISAGLTGIDLCDSQLKASNFEERAENKTGQDFQMATDLTKYNLLHKKLLAAAQNILTHN